MNSIRIALLACATLLTSTAYAANEDVRSQKISLAGLDLTQPVVAAQAYRRIQSAARSVCRDFDQAGVRRTLWSKCVASSIARAVADVNAPVLTAYHAEKAHKARPERVAAR